MRLFTDPRLFNYVILGLYTANIINYAIRRQWNDAWYWFSAASITSSVTFILGK